MGMLLSINWLNLVADEIRTIKKKSNNLFEGERESGSINNFINWRNECPI